MSKRCNSPYRLLSHIMAQRRKFTRLHASTSIIPGQICPLHTMWAVRVRAVGVECFSWNVMPKYVITWSSYITARTAPPSTASGQSRSPLAACIVGRVIKRTRTSHRKQWQHVAPIQESVIQSTILRPRESNHSFRRHLYNARHPACVAGSALSSHVRRVIRVGLVHLAGIIRGKLELNSGPSRIFNYVWPLIEPHMPLYRPSIFNRTRSSISMRAMAW